MPSKKKQQEEEVWFDVQLGAELAEEDPHAAPPPDPNAQTIDYTALFEDWNMTELQAKNIAKLLNQAGGARNVLNSFLNGDTTPAEVRELISRDDVDAGK